MLFSSVNYYFIDATANRPLAKIKNFPLGEKSGASSQESGELIMRINQLNALFRYFMQFYGFFSHF
ncbi:MAG: hypothetical protein EWV54_09245 [Microcystis novacekii Mn_MB_F_20050700_S1D]|uniref:Uncharacterized protein n=1 Tax=Microcystis novacekii Mn_MB_F_20050700_S1D TaxID=2486266 RepID=A0A552J037_9CHRO|nr:MAG: hypothetical protein EWV54_09245 [Microcystis novacekii Mn_MB_F_20050700_S1D]